MGKERRRMIPLIGVWVMIFLLTTGLVACGSSGGSKNSSKSEAKDQVASAAAASSTASQSASGIAADPSAQADFHRQVIYTANLQMQVKDFANARSAIDQLIISSGSYLLSSTEDESSNRLSGSFKIKVPAKGFSTFIADIDKLPNKKLNKSITGEDVTEEYADLSARLKAKEVAEARLLSFMESAKSSTDLVAFSNELAQVQEDIERIKGKMRYIDQNVEYSTINIDMYQTLSGDGSGLNLDEKQSLLKKAGNSLRQSIEIILQLGNSLVIIAAFLLPLLPIIGILVLLVVIVKRRRKRAKSDDRAIPQQNDLSPPGDDPS